MKRKGSVLKLLSMIFMGVGVLFTVLTIAGNVAMNGSIVFAGIFGGFAAAFFVSALVLFIIYYSISKKEREIDDKLVARNLYVMAQITEIDIKEEIVYERNSIDIHPYHIFCRFVGPDGQEFHFQSKGMLYNPAGLLTSDMIKVFVDLQNPDLYRVDLSSVLPENVKLHKFKIGYGAQELKTQGKYIMATTCGVELLGYFLDRDRGIKKMKSYFLDRDVQEKFDMLHMPRDIKGRKFAGFWVLCRYDAPDGVTHIFASRGRYGCPRRPFIGDEIRVYIKNESMNSYYVDSDRITELSQ